MNEPLPDSIDCDMDFENFDRVSILKVILRVLWKERSVGEWDFFASEKDFMGKLENELKEEIEKFENVLNKDNEGEKITKSEWLKTMEGNLPALIYYLFPGNYASVHSFFGGIAAQEAVKLTGKFTPINNIFLHEFYTGIFKNKNLSDFKDQM